MPTAIDTARLHAALSTARGHLLAQMRPAGYWEGRLSSSALSTATAVSALALAGQAEDAERIHAGVEWLNRTQLADGSWGDTPDSPGNLATSLLAVSGLRLARADNLPCSERAGAYLTAQNSDTPAALAAAVTRLYGKDRTFAVPILMNCALAGLASWEGIPALPFELAAFPASLYGLLQMHVVSYALPALIAIGLQLHRRAPARNPLQRAFRNAVTPAALTKLTAIQPENGGFLEATPLTSFVAMSLLPLFGPEQPVVRQCLRFLRASMRDDGSWPIDTNLSAWVTSNSISALVAAACPAEELAAARAWLVARQYRVRHPYTGSPPGGWGWSHLPGSVPDADDTSGAIIALLTLGERAPAADGVHWLLQLQNADGGWPTFCRGWGELPFDASSPDITAHALRALHAADLGGCRQAIDRGFRYLAGTQREDGSWVPLWFGNQYAARHANPVLGTARVLAALGALNRLDDSAHRGVCYLLQSRHPDGGWGGDAGAPVSVEETALTVIGLLPYRHLPGVEEAVAAGTEYLLRRIDDGSWTSPSPIGLYFASLWYAEDLYPVAWTVEALGRVSASAPEDHS